MVQLGSQKSSLRHVYLICVYSQQSRLNLPIRTGSLLQVALPSPPALVEGSRRNQLIVGSLRKLLHGNASNCDWHSFCGIHVIPGHTPDCFSRISTYSVVTRRIDLAPCPRVVGSSLHRTCTAHAVPVIQYCCTSIVQVSLAPAYKLAGITSDSTTTYGAGLHSVISDGESSSVNYRTLGLAGSTAKT